MQTASVSTGRSPMGMRRFQVFFWIEKCGAERRISCAPHMHRRATKIVAEREGFEPSLEFPLNTLSKRAPSTTRPSLREGDSLSLAQPQQIIANAQIPFRIGRRRPSAVAKQPPHLPVGGCGRQRKVLVHI